LVASYNTRSGHELALPYIFYQSRAPHGTISILYLRDSADVIPAVSEPAHLIAQKRTQHSIVVRPTAVHAISTDIICQTIVQHCRTSDLELIATCCVKLRLSLLSNPDLKLICFLLLSANYSTYLFRQRLCSCLTALWRYINSVLLLLLSGATHYRDPYVPIPRTKRCSWSVSGRKGKSCSVSHTTLIMCLLLTASKTVWINRSAR